MFSQSLNVVSLLFLTTLLVPDCSADLPPEIEKCASGDGDCIRDRMNFVLRNFPQGSAQMGLPPVTKVSLKDIVVSKADPKSPVQLNFQLNTADFYGFENANVTKAIGFEKDLQKSRFECYGVIPELTVLGDYEASGKVLLLPINGHGDGKIKLFNLRFGLKIKIAPVERGGITYGKVTKVKSELEIDRFTINLENLFEGNKEISDSLNKIVNENWRDVWVEIQSGIKKGVADVLKKMLSSVLDTVPYKDFYKE